MTSTKGMTVHLDEHCVAALEQLQRQINAESTAGAPPFSLPALARHSIRKWCDHTAKPVPSPADLTEA